MFAHTSSWGKLNIVFGASLSSLALKRHNDHNNSYKCKHLFAVLAYSSRGSVDYHDQEHVAVQANVLELRVLHLESNRKLGSVLSIGNLKTQPHRDIISPTRSYLFQHSHTF